MKVTDICTRLVKAQSYSGEEKAVAEEMKSIMESLMFHRIEVDKYGNVYGIYEGNEPGPTQIYDGHMDTVPVPDPSKWTQAPFGGEIVDGKLYGRGTSDMKGALAAMILAAHDYVRKTEGKFKGRICVAGVVHEECFEGVAAREISKNLAPDYVVIGEASQLNLKHGQRGRGEIVVETFGKPAHSANPEVGINAVTLMTKAIERMNDLKPEVNEHLGKGILALTDIISSPYPGASVIPDYCRTTWDRRLLVGETKASVLAPIQSILDSLATEVDGFQGKVSFASASLACYTGSELGDERFFPGWYFDEKADFVDRVFNNLKTAGFDTVKTTYDFCTNGSHYAGEAGIKTIGFGPSRENLAHTIDEYIEVAQLEKAVEGYSIIMETLQEL